MLFYIHLLSLILVLKHSDQSRSISTAIHRGLGLRYRRTGGWLLWLWFWTDNKICVVSSYSFTVKRFNSTSLSKQSLTSLPRLRTLRASAMSSRMTSAILSARSEVLGLKWLKYIVLRYQSRGFCMTRKNLQSKLNSNIPILRI